MGDDENDKALYHETWTRDGATRSTKKWYCRFVDESGVFRKVPTGCADKQGARLFYLNQLKKMQERRNNKLLGLVVPDEADSEIPPLIEEWRQEKVALKKNAGHIERFVARMKFMTKTFKRLGEITPEKVTAILNKLEFDVSHLDGKGGHKLEGLSDRTINRYRAAIFALFEWLVKSDRWPRNPIRAVKPRAEGDPALDRRALVGDELLRLLAATETVSPRRASIYRLAVSSGLRRAEMSKLRNKDVDLSGDRGLVTVRRANSKNKKARYIPLSRSVTEALRAAGVGEGEPEALVFPPKPRGLKEGGIPHMDTFRNDLARAGIPYKTHEGKIDFHALRTTFATDLVKAGVKLPKTQQLMGHSTPMLTMKFYAKLGANDFDLDIDALDTYRATAATAAKLRLVKSAAPVPDVPSASKAG